MFYVVECESSFFFIFKRRKKTSFYLQLQLTPNNPIAERVLFVASIISSCKSSSSSSSFSSSSFSTYPSSSSISFCSLVLHRSRSTPFLLQVSLRSLRVLFAREIIRYRRNLRNAREIIRYRSRECTFVDQGGKQRGPPPAFRGRLEGEGD